MAFHVHAALAALCVAFVASQAHLPGQIYWNSMLPDVTMPTAISDALVSSGKIKEIVPEGTEMDEVRVNTPAENLFLYYNHGGSDKDEVPVNTPSENLFLYYNHGDIDKDEVPLNTPSENLYLYYNHGDNDKDEVPVNTPSENLYLYYNHGKDEVPVNTPSENLYLYYNQGGSDKEEVVVNPPSIHFFLENDLVPGKQWEMEFPKPKSDGYIFIPRQVADSIPFSSNKLSSILTQFSVEPESHKAQLMKRTLRHCDNNPAGEGEVRACVTSLEAMIDFAIQRLGKNIQAVSTEPEKFTNLQNFTILPDLKRIGDDKVVSCHHMHYTYAVFMCHDVEGARAYTVSLQGTRGTKVKAVAVCHTNTTAWSPDHISFKVLKVKPGGEPVCHFLPLHNLIWTARPHLAMSASGF